MINICRVLLTFKSIEFMNSKSNTLPCSRLGQFPWWGPISSHSCKSGWFSHSGDLENMGLPRIQRLLLPSISGQWSTLACLLFPSCTDEGSCDRIESSEVTPLFSEWCFQQNWVRKFLALVAFFLIFKFFFCYSITVVCLFSPSLHPTPALVAFYLHCWESNYSEERSFKAGQPTYFTN